MLARNCRLVCNWPLERDVLVLDNLVFVDYVFGDRKIGGNAQSITKSRWLHHTSFLWDYDPEDMKYLKHPPRTPKYRSVSMISTSLRLNFESRSVH